MAKSLIIEEESGTCRGWIHPHNGYYAGNFSGTEGPIVERSSAPRRHLHAVVDARPRARTEPSTFDWTQAA